MRLDRTQIAEIIKLHHEASSNLESGRETETREAKEHTVLRIVSRYEKDDWQVETSRKNWPGLSSMGNAGGRSMLLHEK